MNKIITGFLCLFFLTAGNLMAQNRFDALRFTTQFPSADAANMAIGGASVSSYFNYGSVLQNPAVLGMAEESSVQFGLGLRDVTENAAFLGNTRTYDDSQTSITNAGFVYAFPTVQGSLVFGGGYNQLVDFNRAYRVNGRNERSTITDFYLINDFYFDTAFDAFALDYDEFDDEFYSVLRNFTDEPFRGIDQIANVVESGQLGEFTITGATEFMPGMFVGATLGIPVGTYSYRRDFLERDTPNVHDGSPGTLDVDNILSIDRIDADISGFSARLGFVYQPIPQLNIGLSYSIPTRYEIDESYTVRIETTFDNGDFFEQELNGSTSYRIQTPGRMALGLSTNDLPVNLHASVERVGYSRLEFREFGDLGAEVEINDGIRDDFRNVLNYRLGATLNISEFVQPSLGYSYLAPVSREVNEPVQFISGGLRLGINQNFSIDLAVQYGFFDDRQNLYQFVDYQDNNQLKAESVSTSVERFHTMIGVNLRF